MVTDTNFKETLLLDSQNHIVVLDAHADWCQPCKQLEPILIKSVGALGSAAVLKKVDVDANPQLSQMLQIQSLPTVMAVHGGRVVDTFTGARSAAQVDEWLKGVVAKVPHVQAQAAAAPTLEGTIETITKMLDPQASAEALEQIAEACRSIVTNDAWKDQGSGEAKAGLALACLYQGHTGEAQDLVANIRSSHKDKLERPLVKRALAEVDLHDPNSATEGMDAEQIRALADASPEDLSLRIALSKLLFKQGEHKSAIDEALHVVRVDKEWDEAAGRHLLLSYFDVLGEESPLTRSGKRRMANYVFN